MTAKIIAVVEILKIVRHSGCEPSIIIPLKRDGVLFGLFWEVAESGLIRGDVGLKVVGHLLACCRGIVESVPGPVACPLLEFIHER